MKDAGYKVKVVLASSNQGKIREFQQSLANSDLELLLQSSLGVSDIPETGLTFVENALLKARHASKSTGLPALSDDSGIVVDYLKGQPGIYSARFSGEKASSLSNINKLLKELSNVPWEKRTARFYGVIVLVQHEHDPMPIICDGIWEGYVLFEPSIKEGFGYDPVFFVPTHQCAASELTLEEKNRISHRGQALSVLQNKIKRLYDK